MSLPPPPGSSPSADRRKPHWSWWVLGGGLLLLALVVFVVALIVTLGGFFRTDASFDVDSESHAVSVEAGTERALWVEQNHAVTCTVTDAATGDTIDLRTPVASYTKELGDRAYRVASVFDSGSGRLEVRCDGDQSRAQVGPAPKFGLLFGSIALVILVPLLLGGLGIAVLVVTGVRTYRSNHRS